MITYRESFFRLILQLIIALALLALYWKYLI